jgi:translation initiation factor 1
MSRDSFTVYSTETKVCRKCGRAVCACGRAATPTRAPGTVRVGRETKGRKGAGVTVVTGLDMTEAQLRDLLSACKKRLGCGGTLRDGVLEFQGEHRDALLAHLESLGIKARRAGG